MHPSKVTFPDEQGQAQTGRCNSNTYSIMGIMTNLFGLQLKPDYCEISISVTLGGT